MSLQHILESKEAQLFFENTDVRILHDESAHNTTHLVNIHTGERLVLWAESDYSIAGGVPGIYVDE